MQPPHTCAFALRAFTTHDTHEGSLSGRSLGWTRSERETTCYRPLSARIADVFPCCLRSVGVPMYPSRMHYNSTKCHFKQEDESEFQENKYGSPPFSTRSASTAVLFNFEDCRRYDRHRDCWTWLWRRRRSSPCCCGSHWAGGVSMNVHGFVPLADTRAAAPLLLRKWSHVCSIICEGGDARLLFQSHHNRRTSDTPNLKK